MQDSVQLQTVLALYDQETVRNNEQTSYSRLKTSVRFHIDQMMRFRNFGFLDEVVERGAATKSQKGKNAYVERKVGECKCWPPPVCPNCKSETGFICGRKCFFRHVEANEKSSKKSKKGGAKGSVA